ncbi:hypothetical protein [Streptomyces sp. NPDC056796]|uniref:hypothetical protein n=1 Tax=Streptomyces sp. NPDC056796 TaxID=3345947 RepID=UPI00369896BF
MTNGWGWIEEGQRIKDQAREIAGFTEDVRAESIVFNCQVAFDSELDALREENARLREENARLRAGKRTSLEELYLQYRQD